MAPASIRRRTPNVMLRHRERDTLYAVSRKTMSRLADTLGMTEMQVIHLALAELAARYLPRYAPDEGPLKPATLGRIFKRISQGRMNVREKLF